MKTYTLHNEQIVNRTLPEVFAFFERPENLATITPPWLGFTILTPSPIHMTQGATIDYRIRVMGLPMRWRSVISDYRPPDTFVDEQVTGPYSLWRHTHSFHSVEGGTLIRDEVRYVLPLGYLGRLAHALFVRRQLEGIFRYRAQVIDHAFGGAFAR